ncbi:Protein of unknown function [Gryllus bimaculatus]|nr:Protein of unknown function [Gryllus bimaculatus]
MENPKQQPEIGKMPSDASSMKLLTSRRAERRNMYEKKKKINWDCTDNKRPLDAKGRRTKTPRARGATINNNLRLQTRGQEEDKTGQTGRQCPVSPGATGSKPQSVAFAQLGGRQKTQHTQAHKPKQTSAANTVKLKRYDNMQWSFSTKLNSAQR